MDYLHISTRNRIVDGEEVTFTSDGIRNAHFRQLAVESASHATANRAVNARQLAVESASHATANMA
eukprot:4992567-Prymnesium_polylepis.1